MTLVGFKRMTIAVLDDELKVANKIVVEGNMNKGATNNFEITGLSKEAVKTYGSDIPYWVQQKGTGDVKANFGILDLPLESEQEILGRTKATNGVYHIGEATEAPYCAVLTESEDLRGEPVGFGLYVGKFARDSVSSETLTDGDFTPAADDFTFVPISKKIDDVNQTVGLAVGKTGMDALVAELFGAVSGGGE